MSTFKLSPTYDFHSLGSWVDLGVGFDFGVGSTCELGLT